MKRLTLAVLLLISLIAAACGGGDDEPTPTYTVPGGINTSLPRHLTAVAPEPESTVTNANLHVGEQVASGGICASFDFTVGEGMGESPTEHVTLVVGLEDVTDSAVWTVTASEPPTGGTICYASPQPFDAAEQLVTVRYSDSTDRQFIYNWQFTIAESAATASP